ncbi:MAG: carbohydrate-binding domain-containing protein [Ruminococcaceae bacterium]|nr:carbohydrate-binding domain-containing protein [Oscillospiraceae bacterium]
MGKQHIKCAAAMAAVLLSFSVLLTSCQGADKGVDYTESGVASDGNSVESSQGGSSPEEGSSTANTNAPSIENSTAADDQNTVDSGTTTPPSDKVPSGSDVEASTGAATQVVIPDIAPEPETAETPSTGDYAQTSESTITLGETVAVTGSGATVEGKVVTIIAAGTYLVSGSMADGQLVVDTTDESKVVLVLNGVSLTNSDGPAVFVKSAPKRVEIYTAAESVNILSDGTGYVVADEDQVEGEIYPNACIYACEDLRFEGEGTLYINGNADKGVNTKDDLDIRSGTWVVNSVGIGMRGNDSVTVSGGEITVTAGGDGIKSANVETEGKGQVLIENGALYITATGDGIAAATDLTVTGGVVVITTKDADVDTVSATKTTPVYDSLRGPGGGSMPPGGFGGGGGMPGEGNSNKSTISAKGLKATGTLVVSGGKITIDSADDGIHADDAVWIKDGSIYLSANDDGIHADNTLTVSGGVTEIAKSYEGIEANQITISGGTNRITASDDGTNANGGTSMGMGGRPGGWWGSDSSSSTTEDTNTPSPLLTISGGYTVVNAAGDGIDSNGNIVMTGGTLYVYGPTNNGNGPIDFGDGNCNMTISGGTFLAVGSSGMADTAQNNGQAVFAAYMNTIQAGTLIGIKDAGGNVIAAFELPKAIASVVYSSPDLTAGDTYTFVYGGEAGEAVDGVVDVTTYTGYSEMGSLQAY